MEVLVWPETVGAGRTEAGNLVIFHRFNAGHSSGRQVSGAFLATVSFSGGGCWLGFVLDSERDPVEVVAWPEMAWSGWTKGGNSDFLFFPCSNQQFPFEISAAAVMSFGGTPPRSWAHLSLLILIFFFISSQIMELPY